MMKKGEDKPRLKRVAESDDVSLPPARLYLDDIEDIYVLFSDVSDRVELRLDKYELTSLADVAELRAKQTSDVHIRVGSWPYATFQRGLGGFWFHLSDRSNLQLAGLRDATARPSREGEFGHQARLWSGLAGLCLPAVSRLPSWRRSSIEQRARCSRLFFWPR